LEGQLNAFKLSENVRDDAVVLNVKVIEPHPNNWEPGELVWELRATVPVKAKDFVLTIGIVPSGFEQVVPSHGRFEPITGTTYLVGIGTDDKRLLGSSVLWTEN
jgi:hypothetical protein